MLLPYNVDVPLARLPLVNWLLIAVTCVFSVTTLLANRPTKDLEAIYTAAGEMNPRKAEEIRKRLHDPPAPPLSLQRRAFAVSQLVTYVFIHGSAWRLIANLVFLFCAGNAINARLGHVPFLALYFLLGAVAGLAWLAVGQGNVVLGASGAVMGITGLFFVLYPRNEVRIFYWFGGNWAGSFGLTSYWVVLAYLLCDLSGTIFGEESIAYVGHLVATVAGAGIGLALLGTGLVKPATGEENFLQMLGVHESGERFDFRGKRVSERRA